MLMQGEDWFAGNGGWEWLGGGDRTDAGHHLDRERRAGMSSRACPTTVTEAALIAPVAFPPFSPAQRPLDQDEPVVVPLAASVQRRKVLAA
jgi:hypothetical protein